MPRFLADAVAKSHWFDISAAKKIWGTYPGYPQKKDCADLKIG